MIHLGRLSMRWLFCMLLLWAATPAIAEIQIDREYAPYKPIVATVTMPDTPADVKQQTIARWRISEIEKLVNGRN